MAPLVVAATTDLFLQSRISEVVKPLGFEAKFVRNSEELTEAVKRANPTLVILDLSSSEYDPFACARTLKSSSPTLKIFGFFPHVREELMTRAKNSGIDYVVPNSGLLKSLKNVLSNEKVTS